MPPKSPVNLPESSQEAAHPELGDKSLHLKRIFEEMGSVIIAFSGGVDSALLYKVASDVLGRGALGVTGRSPSVPEQDLAEVDAFVKKYSLYHLYVDTRETENPNYQANPVDRCFYCKDELFDQLGRLKEQHNIAWVVDGTNFDDNSDHRPGMRAARGHKVRSPLQEARMTKEDIRRLSQELGLPTWDKPATACLASRFPYGVSISPEKLGRVDRCESFIKGLGVGQIRLRHHEDVARIEILPDDFPTVLENREKIIDFLKKEGYSYITLDLQGFRSGSLNETLSANEQQPCESSTPSDSKSEDCEPKAKKSKEPKFHPKTFGDGCHTLYTDGGCSGNPGPAAWGFVLFDSKGQEVDRGNGVIENATNNVAEYQALIEGLKFALKRKVAQIHALSDSELMVRQFIGRYRVKNRVLQELLMEVQKYRRQFESFEISHVRREENRLADYIVGERLKFFKNNTARKPKPEKCLDVEASG